MEDRKIVPSGKMTETLIGNYLLLGILFGIVSSFINGIIDKLVGSLGLMVLLSLVVHLVIVILLWRLCVATALKKITILKENVEVVIKNLIIFTIITSILLIVFNYYETKDNLNESLESTFEISIYEKYVSALYSEEQKAKYEEEKEKAIKEMKTKIYSAFVVLEIGITAINLGVLTSVKKYLINNI